MFRLHRSGARIDLGLIKNAYERSTSTKFAHVGVTERSRSPALRIHSVQKTFLSKLFQNAVKTSRGGRPPYLLQKGKRKVGGGERVIKFAKFNEPTPSHKDDLTRFGCQKSLRDRAFRFSNTYVRVYRVGRKSLSITDGLIFNLVETHM